MKVFLHRFLMKSQIVRKSHQKKGPQTSKNKVSIYLKIWKCKMTISKSTSMVSSKNSHNGDRNMIFQRQKEQRAERFSNSKEKKN